MISFSTGPPVDHLQKPTKRLTGGPPVAHCWVPSTFLVVLLWGDQLIVSCPQLAANNKVNSSPSVVHCRQLMISFSISPPVDHFH